MACSRFASEFPKTVNASSRSACFVAIRRRSFYGTSGLTNRWSQPLVVTMPTFNFMKQFSMFATLAAASDGSAPSR